ncbi:MAG: hypothetical protein O9293_02855 [Porphyrobacter sp.]|nr:hypothetical protein [Porphyrobacter sp.]
MFRVKHCVAGNNRQSEGRLTENSSPCSTLADMTTSPRLVIFASLALGLAGCTPAPETLFAEGKEAFQAHDYTTAWLQLEEGLKQQPGDTEMQLLLVSTFLKIGEGERANTRLQALPADLRTAPRLKLMQAEADILRGKFETVLVRTGLPACRHQIAVAALPHA